MRGGSIDYDRIAPGYSGERRADPRIGARIHAALGDARTVVNVGAGVGSYEPEGRHVLAVEPSAGMRAQRPTHLAPAIAASAEALPLDDASVDAAMAIITIHHWTDTAAGLRELRRVTKGPVVVLTFDIDVIAQFWMVTDYAPEILEDDRKRFPTVAAVSELLGGTRVESIPIPSDCTDGFLAAHYARPESYLDPALRSAQSVWPRLPAGVEERTVAALGDDLGAGAWDERHGHLRSQPEYDGGLRLVISTP
ncbi:MAG TPA: methyltransferase domain-containing protein [Solirubrobacteraceae bacterium]|nr:methyltransferase domain-containing protein [Solirubrobacteraceae bacterium]